MKHIIARNLWGSWFYIFSELKVGLCFSKTHIQFDPGTERTDVCMAPATERSSQATKTSLQANRPTWPPSVHCTGEIVDIALSFHNCKNALLILIVLASDGTDSLK